MGINQPRLFGCVIGGFGCILLQGEIILDGDEKQGRTRPAPNENSPKFTLIFGADLGQIQKSEKFKAEKLEDFLHNINLVRERGLEPLCLAAPDPKSGASPSSATLAHMPRVGRIPLRERSVQDNLHGAVSPKNAPKEGYDVFLVKPGRWRSQGARWLTGPSPWPRSQAVSRASWR